MYTLNHQDPQLFDVNRLNQLIGETKSDIEAFREVLKQGQDLINSRFQSQMWATDAVHQRAWLVDRILNQAWQRCAWPQTDNVALVAVGGYGRYELHLGSDIDLMILLALPPDEVTRHCIEQFIIFLWDIHLEVGHSVRTLDECEKEAMADVSVITNLIEARLLIGPRSLYKAMQVRTAADRMWSSREFFGAKRQEQLNRYRKFHDTAYNLEPNIKEGPGGLRDIHMIAWVAKRHFGAVTLYDLVQQHGFLTEEEYKTLVSGQEFIWQIRHLLHKLAGRREDRLLFDYQRTLAEAFGYKDDKKRLGVEHFMKQYYRTIKELGSLNDMLLQLFQEIILYGNMPAQIKQLNRRFQIYNDHIEVTHDKVFLHYPFALLEVFLLMQQHPEIQGIRASTLRLVRQYRHLIDEACQRDIRSRSLFIEIIRQPKGLTKALRHMNQYGVLGAYIPAFGKVVGQMQYDLFHVYTVDQHTLFLIRNLRRMCVPEYRDELPLCSSIINSLPKLELLFLAALFHDIAKGRGGDHSVLGEVDALQFCQAHGLSDYDTRLVGWLVRNHLLMSMTAQRKDISDPEVIKQFASQMMDSEYLDYLYVLTVSDIRGTSPKLWNSWKDALLADLYRKTKKVLQYGTRLMPNRQARVQAVRKEAAALLDDLFKERVNTLWDSLGDDYFLCSSANDIARETQAILSHKQTDQPLVMERQDNQAGTELIVIYTQDRDYLFASTTRYLEQHALSVVDAYVIPTEGIYTFSGYTVLAQNGGELSDPLQLASILNDLTEALRQADPKAAIPPINRRLPRQIKHFPVPTRITFSHDTTHEHTVLEVVTTDRPGVLSRIAQAFSHCEVRLKRAKILTFGSRVEDIFFITDYDNQALYTADRLDCLRDQLHQLLDDIPETRTEDVERLTV